MLFLESAISVKPALYPGPSWCLHYDGNVLEGFASAWDAWAFAVAHGLDDPTAMHPDGMRQWTNRPPAEVDAEPVQMNLF